MRAVELFAGGGGASLGLQRAGFEVVAAVEKDAAVAAIYAANHGSQHLAVAAVEEWLELGVRRYEGVDVLAGGPPCQPFSAAGQGRGQYDERDGFPHFIEAVRRLRPRAFICENVRGLTFTTHLEYLQQVVGDLRALGYEVFDRVLDAADFGVPQRRQRLFLVGFREAKAAYCFRWPATTHADPELLTGQLFVDPRTPWVTVRQSLQLGRLEHRPNRDIREGRPETSWQLADRPAASVQAEVGTMEVPVDSAAEADVRMTGPARNTAHIRRHRGRSQERPDSSVDEPSPAVIADAPSGRSGLYLRVPGGVEATDVDEPAPTVRPISPHGGAPRFGDMLVPTDKHPASALDEPAKTISAGGDGHSNHDHLVALEPTEPQPQSRRVMSLDEPADTINTGYRPNGGGVMPQRIAVENPGSLAVHDLDQPAPTVRSQAGRNSGNPPYLPLFEGHPVLDNGFNRSDPLDLDAPSRTIPAHVGKEGGDPNDYVPGGSKRRSRAQRIGEGSVDVKRTNGGPRKGERVLDIEAPAPAQYGIDKETDILPQSQRLLDPDQPADTIAATHEGQGTHNPRLPGSDHQGKRGYYRRLTAFECSILQGFPPYCPHPEHGYREGEPYHLFGTKTVQHRAVGNACPPQLTEAVARAVASALECASPPPEET